MSNLSPEGSLRKQTPRGPLDGLSILYVFDEQKLRFQFWAGNPPFWNPRKPLLSGWVGGWVVIFWVLWFSSFSSIITSKMRWFQIWCQKLSTDFLSKVMSTLKFQNSTKEDHVPPRKMAQKIHKQKIRLSPAESLWNFQKKSNRKNSISGAKIWKILDVQKWH